MVWAVDQGLVGLRNRDALLFVVGPDNGPAALHSSRGPGETIDNAVVPGDRRLCGPVQHNHWRSIAGRDHSDDR